MLSQIKVRHFLIKLVLICNFHRISGTSYSEISPDKMIADDNYPVENHTVQTQDGYILELFRIRGSSNSVPVMIHHGLFESSPDWIQRKNKSLAYILWNQGYDVWLANARGNTYSKRHKTLSTSDPQFWDFSWHEIGIYDLPATITYISNTTNKTIFYVGHSMGSSVFSVMASTKPEIAKNVRAMFSLAPAVYIRNLKQPFVRLLGIFWREFQLVCNALGIHEFFGRNEFLNLFADKICPIPVIGETICSFVLFFIAGFSPKQLDYSLLPSIWSKLPGGTSTKLFLHILQQITVNEFRNFDYGKAKNLIKYKRLEPPTYKLEDIQVPIAVFYSENDLLVSETDAKHFYEQLTNKLGIFKVDYEFNHFDFLWSINAPEAVFTPMLEIMKKFSNNNKE